MQFKTLRDFEVRGKRVVLREDFNVPMNGPAVADFTRIDAALPTLRYLHENGARTIVLSHLGRPDGSPNSKYSLRPVAEALAQRLGLPVQFAADCIGPAAEHAANALSDGGILLLENVRFHAAEEQNEPGFAKQLASLGDIYINDAFGTAHRAHASTEGIAHLLPAAAGFLMEAELHALAELIKDPEAPFVCVIGGAKVKDKVGVFKNLMDRVTAFCIGGGMANTFLAAQGKDVGTSLRDDDLEPAKSILELAAERNVALHLPTDVVAAPAFDADAQAKDIPLSEIDNLMILDIGTNSAQQYASVIENARTIVFNGPMGVYEKKAYQNGTKVVGEAIARATRKGAKSVVGGGDAAAAAHELGFADAMTHVSTGGGATLEFLEGKTLPGVAALMAGVPSS
ncbi:MAG: phosphoglycerate kinase [Candidatus Eremiobacteraeota bacterium]|nr:phosphoglycerate kinase [Candidatus Eremiobacteraeota bacterium]